MVVGFGFVVVVFGRVVGIVLVVSVVGRFCLFTVSGVYQICRFYDRSRVVGQIDTVRSVR